MTDTIRTPPKDIGAEQAVLGSLFISPDKLVEVSEYLDAKDFYAINNQVIYQAIKYVSEAGENVDPITIKAQLEKQGDWETSGGTTYLVELVNSTPTSQHVVSYAKRVAEKALMRRAIEGLSQSLEDVYDGSLDVTDIISRTEGLLTEIGQANSRGDFRDVRDVIGVSQERIEKRAESDGNVTGLSTGLRDLDKLTTGLHEDNLIILAARPAMGKTALALNIAQHVAVCDNKPVAIFSLEMGAEDLVDRMLSAEGAVDSYHIRTGQLDMDEWKRLIYAQGMLAQAPIYIDDTAGVRISEIRARAKKLAQQVDGLGLIVVDYLQLISGKRSDNRVQEVSDISRQLKIIAKELKVPVIALSQLSRSVEQRQDKRPILSDLRESGSIEQDADLVLFLYREDYYRNDSDLSSDVSELILAKNRHGSLGTVELYFHKDITKFSDIKESEQTW